MTGKISGNIVDIVNQKIFPGTIKINKNVISEISKDICEYKNYIMPGFVDSHIHIESSMLTPSEFARIAVVHGTVCIVSDPHEIANVLGIKGVYYMLNNASKVPFKFCFGAPSCVPASPFETSGKKLDKNDIEELMKNPNIGYLAELMNIYRILYRNSMLIDGCLYKGPSFTISPI